MNVCGTCRYFEQMEKKVKGDKKLKHGGRCHGAPPYPIPTRYVMQPGTKVTSGVLQPGSGVVTQTPPVMALASIDWVLPKLDTHTQACSWHKPPGEDDVDTPEVAN